jgi:hypothetical protein
MKLLKTMKIKLKKEAGQALPMALVLLALGGLLGVPTLAFMTTNLNANRIIVEKTEGIYAADAGIQDAVWKLGNDIDPFSGGNSYDLTETLNDMTVTVEKQALATEPDGDLYTLKSTAKLNGQVKAVIIAQAFKGSDFSWLFEHAITSSGSVTTKKSDIIYGGILFEDSYDYNADVRSGDIEQGTVTLPTEAMLSAFYWEDVKNLTPYSSGTISVSGGTASNPVIIPSLYRNGNLSITGNGYGKLSGTVYVTGKFSVDDKNSIINLDGKTIYSTYYNNCSGDAVYFKPGCTVYGPGCIIGVGNVNFQPNLGMGDMLLGAEDVDGCNPDSPDKFLLSRFKATATGKLTSFQVKCSGDGNIKVALYADNGQAPPNAAPTTLLHAVDTADNLTVMASWNPINFPEINIIENNYYWMAAISDSPVICKKTLSSENKYKTDLFTGFTFPKPTAPPADQFTRQTTEQYMLRGYTGSQEFIFLMSVKCETNLQPNASFYGSIAGNTNVNLQPGCTLNLVGLPDEGLDFPSMGPGGGGGGGGGSSSPPLRNYNIQ